MSTTTSTYLSIENNLARYQKMIASEPSVKTATDYYAANIGNVKSISDLVGNYRLLSYALTAYGLGDQVNNKALVTKVLEGGYTSSKALANTLSNPNWAKFAKAFDFVGSGASSVSTTDAVSTTAANYDETKLESQEGQQDVGVQLALYFQRVAPTISSSYNVLGDKNLLEAFQTIFGVTLNTNGNIDTNASIVSKLMPMSDLTRLDQAQVADRTVYCPIHAALRSGRPRRFDAVDGDRQRYDDVEQPQRRDDDPERRHQRQQQLRRVVDRRAVFERTAHGPAEPVARRLSAASLRQASRA